MEPTVSVIVVNYNAGHHLAACIGGLRAQTFDRFEVIIVDNGSADGSLESAIAAADGDPRFMVDRAGANLGFAAGNNRGAAQARAPWIATLNPDAVPAPDWLRQLLDCAEANPDVAMFGSTQYDAADPDRLDGAGDRYFAAGVPWRDRSRATLKRLRAGDQNAFAVFAPCAAGALYRADAFREAGGFDARFFCYVEDVDLAFRMRLAGHRCLQVTGATIRHVGGVSSGGDASDFARYYGTRNLVWCFVKNMPLPLLVLLTPVPFLTIGAILLRNAARGQGWVAARAIAGALYGIPAMIGSRGANRANPAGAVAIARAVDWNPLAYLRG